MERIKQQGREHFSRGEYAEALECYSMAIEVDDLDHLLYSNRSACLCMLGNYEKALQDALRVTSLKPEWPKGYSRLGDALLGLGKKKDALMWFKTGLKYDPENQHMKERAEMLEKEDQEKKPIQRVTLEELRQQRQEEESKISQQQDRLEKRVDTSSVSRPSQPPVSSTNNQSSEPQTFPSNSPRNTANSAAERSAKIESLKNEGNKAFQEGNNKLAIDSYSHALELDPDNPVLLSNRSACFCLIGQYKRSLCDANRALSLRPDWPRAYSRQGDALLGMGCLKAAIQAYVMGLELEPDNVHMKLKLKEAMDEQNQPPAPQSPVSSSSEPPAPVSPTPVVVPASNPTPSYSSPYSQKPNVNINVQRNEPTTREESVPSYKLRQSPTSDVTTPTTEPNRQIQELFTLRTPMEQVTKQWYDASTRRWFEEKITVQVDDKPFSEGNMRYAYRMLDYSKSQGNRAAAGKMIKPELGVDQSQFWNDLEMYAISQNIAKAFNSYGPPKKVRFVEAFLILRESNVPRHQRVVMVEDYMTGKFKKYNNNDGWTSDDDRNTPQAFTHFSYEYTKRKMMIVDIQGVGDLYTDPQIHTFDGKGFGPGNWGDGGIKKFFASHICNPVCQHLRLPLQRPVIKEGGTVLRPPTARTSPPLK